MCLSILLEDINSNKSLCLVLSFPHPSSNPESVIQLSSIHRRIPLFPLIMLKMIQRVVLSQNPANFPGTYLNSASFPPQVLKTQAYHNHSVGACFIVCCVLTDTGSMYFRLVSWETLDLGIVSHSDGCLGTFQTFSILMPVNLSIHHDSMFSFTLQTL